MFMNFTVAKIRTSATLLLGAYWLALFVATHLPRVPIQFASPSADKWEHLTAYGLLAILLAARQSLWQPLNWKSLGRVAAIVALYGIFDELTQIPVGRHADVMDWFADITGCALGLAVFSTARSILMRRRRLT